MAKNLKNNRDPTFYSTTDLRDMVEKGVGNSNRLNGNSPGAKQDEKEETDDMWNYFEAQAAFLGPSLWDNGDLKMEYMDLDEFLSENGIPVGENNQDRAAQKQSPSNNDNSNDSTPDQASSSSSADHRDCITPPDRLKDIMSPEGSVVTEDDGSVSGCSTAQDDNTPEKCMPVRSVAAKRKRTAVSIASSTNGNTSDDGSYVPGHDFDPKSRPFSQEELRPQPMSKKSKKQYVPDDLKDDKYWARRRKNNMAAKRSRDARRVKENQIAMRAAFLEKENAVLRAELDKVSKLYASALKRLEKYENPTKKY